MVTLKIPSAEFANAALAASAEAGYLGSVFLLTYRLSPELELELRTCWADLHDLTGKDIVVLITGVQTRGCDSIVHSSALQRHLFSDGLALVRSDRKGFDKRFQELLRVATPTPETPFAEASAERLIAAAGVREISSSLGIRLRQLPAILLQCNKENRQFLVLLGNESAVFSPVSVISEVAKHLDDIQRSTREIENGLRIQETEMSAATIRALKELGFVTIENAGDYPNRTTYGRPIVPSADASAGQGVGGYRYDVFLSHNSRDKRAVRDVAKKLRNYGLRVWYDEWVLPPGQASQSLLEDGIKKSKAFVVFVCKDGLGPWQNEEQQAAIRLAVKTKRSVIPVLLPGAPEQLELPPFLANRTWIDLRRGLTEDLLASLKWGITGKPPVATSKSPKQSSSGASGKNHRKNPR